MSAVRIVKKRVGGENGEGGKTLYFIVESDGKIPDEYTYVSETVAAGLRAAISQNGAGYIDAKTCERVCPFDWFDWVDNFYLLNDGTYVAAVQGKDGMFYVIDRTFNPLFEGETFDDAGVTGGDLVVRKGRMLSRVKVINGKLQYVNYYCMPADYDSYRRH